MKSGTRIVPINAIVDTIDEADLMDGGASPKETRRRRFWSADEKRRMIAESVAPGASVSKVAQRYGVNANLLFTWRRQAGVSQTPVEAIHSAFLPVKVADDSADANVAA